MSADNLFFISKPSQFSTFLKILFSLLVIYLLIYFQNILDPIFFFCYSSILSLLNQNDLIDKYQYGFILSGFTVFLFMLALHSFLKTFNTKYFFYNDILIIEKGIINKNKSYIEYFRIKDYNIKRTLIARILNRCSVSFITTDRTHKNKHLNLINNFYPNEQKIRKAINDVINKTGRGREVDIV